jgi:hypothetical protein
MGKIEVTSFVQHALIGPKWRWTHTNKKVPPNAIFAYEYCSLDFSFGHVIPT